MELASTRKHHRDKIRKGQTSKRRFAIYFVFANLSLWILLLINWTEQMAFRVDMALCMVVFFRVDMTLNIVAF